MIKFKKVSRLAAADFNLPVRKTKNSAGYDFEVAEDIVIPTWTSQLMALSKPVEEIPASGITLDWLAVRTKATKAKPTLVSTGVKCYLEEGYYLELSVRSSTPLKYWIILANSVGIIDADYCDNPDNEGEIFFQVINLSPYPIQLKKGDIIGQGIIKKYEVTDDDKAAGERTGGFGSTSKHIGVDLGFTATGSNNPYPTRGLRAEAGLIEDYSKNELEDIIQSLENFTFERGMYK